MNEHQLEESGALSQQNEHQLAFHFDQRACTGCMTCQIACKDRHDLPTGVRWRRVDEFADGGFTEVDGAVVPHVRAWWLSLGCNHCQQPACLPVCPAGAISKRAEDGVVLLDQTRCIGCRRCLAACPYGAIQYDPDSRKAGKCDFCREDLRQGQTPACVGACPMRVLGHGRLEDLQRRLGPGDRIKGMPDPSLTGPSLVVTGHRDAILPR